MILSMNMDYIRKVEHYLKKYEDSHPNISSNKMKNTLKPKSNFLKTIEVIGYRKDYIQTYSEQHKIMN